MSITVIAGLGNTGSKYRNTRHNIGFDVVDTLASKLGATWKLESKFEAETAIVTHNGRKLLLVKPQTFVNASGRALGAILRYRSLQASDLMVIYDDITLDVGRAKLNQSGGAGGHNGIADLLQQIGDGFHRYRIGIGAKPHKEMDLADYVLGKFSADDQKLLANRMPTYFDHLRLVIDKGSEHAMNFINQRTATQHERND